MSVDSRGRARSMPTAAIHRVPLLRGVNAAAAGATAKAAQRVVIAELPVTALGRTSQGMSGGTGGRSHGGTPGWPVPQVGGGAVPAAGGRTFQLPPLTLSCSRASEKVFVASALKA